MEQRDPRSNARYLLGAVLLGLLLSQPGHALAYFARLGPAALAVQSQGVHAYFPALFQFTGASIGAIALATLVLIAGARLVIGRALDKTRLPGTSAGLLFLVLAVVQLNVFFVQEILEGAANYSHGPDAYGMILAWGMLGQFPLSVLAAFALSWLSSPLRAAIRVFRSPVTVSSRPAVPVALADKSVPVGTIVQIALGLSQVCPAAFLKRGPPLSVRLLSS